MSSTARPCAGMALGCGDVEAMTSCTGPADGVNAARAIWSARRAPMPWLVVSQMKTSALISRSAANAGCGEAEEGDDQAHD